LGMGVSSGLHRMNIMPLKIANMAIMIIFDFI